jgi:alkylation response protein AidB-like acyl-CoA dehydrogenase
MPRSQLPPCGTAADVLPQGEWPTKYAGPAGEGPDGFNAFHGAIAIDELCRCASGGMVWAVCGGLGIGLPPVLHFGSPELQDRVAPGCLAGEKFICLCITEPYAGSDVAAIRTTAVKDPTGKARAPASLAHTSVRAACWCGGGGECCCSLACAIVCLRVQFYVVNGEKKWITNGVFADFFTVAVRTGGPGAGGLSLLLIERGPGVTTKQMDCQGVWASGTTYITFEDVKVPVENLIGAENDGFKMIMCVARDCPFGVTRA